MNFIKLFLLPLFMLCFACGGQEEGSTISNPETREDISINKENKEKQNKTDRSNSDTTNDISQKTGNQPPKIEQIAIEIINGNPRDGFKASIKAIDPEDDFIGFIYEWKYNDEYLAGETNETLSWQEEFQRGGEITLEVIPYDNQAQGIWQSRRSFIIPNSPPEILSQPPTEITNGKFNYEVKASDPDGDQLTISIENAPEGMSLNENIVEWDITNIDSGDYNMEILVADEQGATTTQILNLTVNQN